jgi:uncharacterized protein
MTKARLALSLLATYSIVCIAAGIELAELSLRLPKQPPRDEVTYRSRVQTEFQAQIESVEITAADGAVLKAWFVQPARPNGESVILLHGITDNRIGVSGFGDIFLRRGYSILLPDSRAHGESGGTIATYGIIDRQDVRRWVGWLRQRDPGCTYLFGESMGAAIGLQATAVTSQICAAAVESPYSSFREIAYERLGRGTHLGSFFWRTAGRPVIEVAIGYARLRYGLQLTNASPHTAVEESKTPILLIAGTADRNIPMHHAIELYRDCASHCELWIVPGADHGGASTVAPVEFQTRILHWFREHDEPRATPIAEAGLAISASPNRPH